jgi:hypothetical protein
MPDLSLASRISLYVLLAVMGLVSLYLASWQIMVLQGKPMKNPDGSVDDWHEQKTHYGIAFADTFLSCPLGIAAIALILAGSRWGYYLLALVSFWWVWANIMTTATSLRFEKPNITPNWLLTFPFGILVGLAYIAWTVIHFDAIYFP